MYSWHLLLLVFSVMFVYISKRVIPVLHTSLSAANDWLTLLFFRPFHLLVAVIAFFIAFFLVRYVVGQNSKIVFSPGRIPFYKRLASFLLLISGCGVMVYALYKHLIIALVVIGIYFSYDMVEMIRRKRRYKRLRTAFRGQR